MKPIIWNYHIPLFSSFIWGNIAKGFGITVGILSVFFFIIGAANGISLPEPSEEMLFAGGFVGIIIFFTLLVFIILFWRGFDVTYRIDKSGVYQTIKGMSSKVHKWTIILGLLGRSRSAVGTGLLAQEGEERFISWSEMKKVKIDEKRRYIHISRAFLGIYPIDMFCTKNNFETVIAIIRQSAHSKLRE